MLSKALCGIFWYATAFRVWAVPVVTRNATVGILEETSLTFLYQNELNATDDPNHVGAILLDPMTQKNALRACQSLGESLLSRETLQQHEQDFLNLFSYLQFKVANDEGYSTTQYHTADGIVSPVDGQYLGFWSEENDEKQLSTLCTQTGNITNDANPSGPGAKELTVKSDGNWFTGIRDQKSFRFIGIPYADSPQRFQYSQMYSKVGQRIQATAYGSICAQAPDLGSEDCLFLNIQTPYVPKDGSKRDLRPVMFWIHGGGYTGGAGSENDGGNLASREDIVVVTINYRLSTLGFLAIPGTEIKGNFGIADQILALEWTVQNIAHFGGDPNRITIIGESAGAASVRVLLGSPPAIDKFQGAVSMSNLGGGVSLGLTSDYATTYSNYLTIEESYDIAGQQIFNQAGCNETSLNAQIDCLEGVPANVLVGLTDVARYVVQDGHYVNSPELDILNRNKGTAYVPVIFGVCANDGASSITYPAPTITTEEEGIASTLGISAQYAQSIISSGHFPYYDSGNFTLDTFNVSQRVATDVQFRCIDQATVYAGSQTGAFPRTFYYQFERTEGGYDPNNVGGAPVEPGYPNGNPNLPYFRLHGSDVGWLFAGPITLRDAADLYGLQLISGYFAEFIKSGQPNPSIDYLLARGYQKSYDAIMKTGPWEQVQNSYGPIRLLDYPSTRAEFQDLAQCAWLNYSINYFTEHK